MASVTSANLIAIPTAFRLGGYHFALSHNAVPITYNQPSCIATPAFTHIYMTALKQPFLPTAATNFASFSYLAYDSHATNDTSKRNLYSAAAAMVLGIGLTTKLVMLSGVERLLVIGEKPALLQSNVGVDDEAARLSSACVAQIRIRAMLGMAAGVVGLYAVMLSMDRGERNS